jgi:hypothetical protein
MPIVYKGLYGDALPANTTAVSVTDDNIGPLLKVWLLLVTNTAFWEPSAGPGLTAEQKVDFSAAIGAHPVTIDAVVGLILNNSTLQASVHAAAGVFQTIVKTADYEPQPCPNSAGTIAVLR